MKMPAGFNDYLNADNILGQIYKNCKLKKTSWTVGSWMCQCRVASPKIHDKSFNQSFLGKL